MPVQATSVSREVGQIAREWEGAYQSAPEAFTSFVGNAVRNSGKYFVPAGEMAAGGWLATEQGRQALHLIRGKDGTVWKASTSTSDRAIGTACHLLMSMVGAGMAVHGALKVVQNIAADIAKK